MHKWVRKHFDAPTFSTEPSYIYELWAFWDTVVTTGNTSTSVGHGKLVGFNKEYPTWGPPDIVESDKFKVNP